VIFYKLMLTADPRTKAFITHCGVNGLNEASAHGVPFVALPLFADQMYNAAVVEKCGVGVYVDIRSVTTDSLSKALAEVLTQDKLVVEELKGT
jgi:glucuronosyltransferase